MTKWEYATVARVRDFEGGAGGGGATRQAKKWDPEDLNAMLNKYGNDGWELVGVTTRSDLGGGGADSLGGCTTSEVFLFKRPKS